MDIKDVRRVIYWTGYLIFLVILILTFSSKRMPLFLRLIILLLMAVISAKYCLEYKYGGLSILLVILASVLSAAILATAKWEFIIMAILYAVAFFSSTHVWEKNLLGI